MPAELVELVLDPSCQDLGLKIEFINDNITNVLPELKVLASGSALSSAASFSSEIEVSALSAVVSIDESGKPASFAHFRIRDFGTLNCLELTNSRRI